MDIDSLLPKKISNPPFRPFINYRIGTYSTFKKSLIDSIRRDTRLAKWTLEFDKDRYGLALVEMWAYLCDILTFYQERIATESFVRTAQLEDSVIKLLQIIGHTSPANGAAASTFVRFIADEKHEQHIMSSSSSPPTTLISPGFKVKSVPEKGEESITFETDECVSIKSDHNLLRIDGWKSSFKLKKGSTNLTLDKIYPDLSSNDFLLITDDLNADVIQVIKKIDNDKKSQVFWTSDEQLRSEYTLSNTKIYKFTQLARPFGYNASPPIVSNLHLTLYKIKEKDGTDIRPHQPMANMNMQLVNPSGDLISQKKTGENGILSFANVLPNSYKIRILKSEVGLSGLATDYLTSSLIPASQVIMGYQSNFDVSLDLSGTGILVVEFKVFQNDLTSLDHLESTIYLDKPYKNLEQESPVLIVKDSSGDKIDVSKQLFKLASSGQEFHSNYGMSAESSKITLQKIDGGDSKSIFESEKYGIRNSLILTNPSFELSVDPQSAFQELTCDREKMVLEGIHTGLKAGMFLGIKDNTSVFSGTLVEDNTLLPLKGYTIRLYKTQGQVGEPSSDFIHDWFGPPLEIKTKITKKNGSFRFENLYAGNYYVSVYLPNEFYWETFVKRMVKTKHNESVISDNAYDTDGITGANIFDLNNEFLKITERVKNAFRHSLSKTTSHHSAIKFNITVISALEISKSLAIYLVEKIRDDQGKITDLENRFSSALDKITNEFTKIEKKLGLMNLGSFLSSKAQHNCIQISISEKSSRDGFLEIGKMTEMVKTRINNLVELASNVRITNSVLFLLKLSQEMILITQILKEATRLATNALNTPPQSADRMDCLVGSTNNIDLQSNSCKKITLRLDLEREDKEGYLTYVAAKEKFAKMELTKLAEDPIFKEGKTCLNLDWPLQYSYVKGFAEVFANVVSASNGETVNNEILGSGDASLIHQEFKLSKNPLSYVISNSSPKRIKSTLEVFVNDTKWEERDDFTKSTPTDRHYITSLDEGKTTKITFGDGIRGSTPPTGVDNIHANYRIGVGSKGNVGPDTPIVASIDNPAVKSVFLPFGSFGGTDKLLSELKRVRTTHIITLDRAISPDDYSVLAKTFGEIAKARAFQTMQGDGQQSILLVVAAQGGRIVDSASMNGLRTYLDGKRDTNIPLDIQSFVPVPVDIVAEVKINVSFLQDQVVSKIKHNLGPGLSYTIKKEEEEDEKDEKDAKKSHTLFAFERLNFGEHVTLNDVYSAIGNVPGVDYAVVKKFNRRDSNVPVQDVISAKPNEILQCNNDPLDPIQGNIQIIATGGIKS